METNLIEIRQKASNSQTSNGKFNYNLKQHLTLNDGDELNIRNIYIDSKKESNTIALKEDVVLTMDICRGWTMNSDYIVHYGNTDGFLDVDDDKHIYLVKGQATGTLEDGGYVGTHDTPLSNIVSLGAPNTEGVGDTYTYYPTYRVPAPAPDTYRYLTEFTYRFLDYSMPFYGDFDVLLFGITLPKVSTSTPVNTIPITNGVIFNVADGFKLIDPSEDLVRKANTDPGFEYGSVPTDNNDILEPVIQKINIPIKAGNYQPSILAETINLKLNTLNNKLYSQVNAPGFGLTKNPPLFVDNPSIFDGARVGQTIDFYETPLNVANGVNRFYHMVSEDNSAVILKVADLVDGINNTVTNELMTGSQTFQFIFDEITQTFKIENLHNPYYVTVGDGANASSAVGISMKDFTVGIERIMTMNTKRGDFKIVGLTTDEKTGNFWFDKLGLNTNVITNITSVSKNYGGTTGELNVPSFGNSFEEDLGVKRTDALATNQLKLENKLFNPNYLSYSGDAVPPTPLLLPTDDTISIFGAKTLTDLVVTDAYFKVVISGKQYSNKLFNTDGTELISAIVGKYYSGASYTNGFSSDGITYTHRGAPITISNFDIQILSSDNSLPNIGPDNSIIIQINNQIKNI
jgi:hypothetical protein